MRGRTAVAVGLVLTIGGSGALALVLCRDEVAAPRHATVDGRVARAQAPSIVLALEPTRRDDESAEPAPVVGRAAPLAVPGATQVPLEEGARQVAGYLVAADRVEDVMALGKAIADDAEMRARVEAEATRLRGDASPELRARGVLLLAALGTLDPTGWRAALGGESDAQARAKIAESAPYGRGEAADAAISTALLDVAGGDPAPAVRASAIRALGRKLDGAQVGELVRVLRDDRDPQVRAMAANWLRGTRLSDPAAVRGLLASANQSAEDMAVRRASVMALLRIEDRAPGALAQAGGSLEQVQRLLDQVSDDRG